MMPAEALEEVWRQIFQNSTRPSVVGSSSSSSSLSANAVLRQRKVGAVRAQRKQVRRLLLNTILMIGLLSSHMLV
jgi:hypothetical protein